MHGTEVEFVVSPFTVVIDTREQAPWLFLNVKADAKDNYCPVLVKTVRRALKTGDYSLEGLEDRVTVERKSHEDLVQSVGHGRARFEREFKRMQEFDYAAVVVEASLAHVIHQPPPHSKMNPKAVVRTAISWSIRYGVHWYFAPTRSHAEMLTYRILERFWKIHQEPDFTP